MRIKKKFRVYLAHKTWATVITKVLQPTSPPPTGVDWPVDVDWPRIEVEVRLPSLDGGYLVPSLRSYPEFILLGEKLQWTWGVNSQYGYRQRTLNGSGGPTINEAVALINLQVKNSLLALRELIKLREERLRQRRRNTRAARQGCL